MTVVFPLKELSAAALFNFAVSKIKFYFSEMGPLMQNHTPCVGQIQCFSWAGSICLNLFQEHIGIFGNKYKTVCSPDIITHECDEPASHNLNI